MIPWALFVFVHDVFPPAPAPHPLTKNIIIWCIESYIACTPKLLFQNCPLYLGNCTTMHTINMISYSPRYICIWNTIATPQTAAVYHHQHNVGKEDDWFGEGVRWYCTETSTKRNRIQEPLAQHHQPPHDKYSQNNERGERWRILTSTTHHLCPCPWFCESHQSLLWPVVAPST